MLVLTRDSVRGFFDGFGFVFIALRARAFPAGDRFVAGFSRVDFALEADLIDRLADDRGESFFTLLANGVLMRKLPRGWRQPSIEIGAKQARKLNIALLLNQRKSRVCRPILAFV